MEHEEQKPKGDLGEQKQKLFSANYVEEIDIASKQSKVGSQTLINRAKLTESPYN